MPVSKADDESDRCCVTAGDGHGLDTLDDVCFICSLKPPAPATDALLSRMKELQLQPTQQHQRVGSPQQQVAPVVTSKVKGKENIGSGRSRDHVTVVTDNNNGETYTRGRLLGKVRVFLLVFGPSVNIA